MSLFTMRPRLITRFAQQWPREDCEDAWQSGYLQALMGYRPTHGASFETYAERRIHAAFQQLWRDAWLRRRLPESPWAARETRGRPWHAIARPSRRNLSTLDQEAYRGRLRADLQAFGATLTLPKFQQVWQGLLAGEKQRDIAATIGCKESRVSQIRDVLLEQARPFVRARGYSPSSEEG